MEFGYGVAAKLGAEAPHYDEYVEFGTSKMAARPSLRNALDKVGENAEQHFVRAMAKEFPK